MRISVVINTYNRGPSLRATLRALKHQTYDAFEVVVVNGPSLDNTQAVLDEFAGLVRVENCPEVHLSKSRNIGIAAASGEVVAFIDDDAIPEPRYAFTWGNSGSVSLAIIRITAQYVPTLPTPTTLRAMSMNLKRSTSKRRCSGKVCL